MIYKILSLILGLPKSIYFNFKYLSIKDAVKMPIILSYKVSLRNLSGKVQIKSDVKTGMIKIGFNNVGIFDKYKQRSIWNVEGWVIFNGKISLGHGTKISVGKNGELSFGNNVVITAETSIVCEKNIHIGENCLISWENLIMDTDYHNIINENGEKINENNSIVIEDNVWIGCRCTILKGSYIKNNTVIGANSLVNKFLDEGNCIIAGNPTKLIRKNITWN